MSRDAVSELVSHATELERRDGAVAAELETLSRLAARAGDVRSRGAAVREALARIPTELDELEHRTQEANDAAAAAGDELRSAEERLAGLERSRRRRGEETERARREVETARQRLVDAEANVERLRARAEQLRADERSLRVEGAGLARSAAAIATDLSHAPRVADDAGREPGKSLAALDDWGQLVRSALLVARGTLEAERERIIAEANSLGASALGENLGATSVALVRRRLETELR